MARPTDRWRRPQLGKPMGPPDDVESASIPKARPVAAAPCQEFGPPEPPPMATTVRRSNSDVVGRRVRKNTIPAMPIALTLSGVLLGCVVGFYAAHHFAFYGGFVLFAEPYSPARHTLVPGHMLLCGILLGLAGFGLGLYLHRRN